MSYNKSMHKIKNYIFFSKNYQLLLRIKSHFIQTVFNLLFDTSFYILIDVEKIVKLDTINSAITS